MDIVAFFVSFYSQWSVIELYRIVAALSVSIIFVVSMLSAITNWKSKFRDRRELTTFIFVILFISGLSIAASMLIIELVVVPNGA